VGLNAAFLDPGVSGGSETYVHCLVPALLAARPGLRFELATTRRAHAALASAPWAGEVELIRLPCDDDEPVRRTAVERLALPRLARRRGWKLLHSLANRGPRRPGVPHVLTVFDVIFFHHRTMGRLSTHGMRWAVRTGARQADAVITISQAAAADVAATLGIPPERITAIPLGAGRERAEALPLDGVRSRYELEGGRAIVCVAAKRPHKNQALLVEALPRLADDTILVLVGHDEGYGAELEARARQLGVAARVRMVEGVKQAELEALWSLAACAAFPTRAEGFGLPILEAMRRDIPVACSDIPVLREVGGDAVHFFPPNDALAAAAAIEAAMGDRTAPARGRERAAQFSWERAGERTLEVYERVLAARHAG
jgi:glycosyltransferase involved in cell wall biosynthesis